MNNVNQEKNHGLMSKALNAKGKAGPEGLLAKSNKENNMNQKIQEQNAIVLKDGIFSIKENLQTAGVVQDPDLKALVDSVLR